jgi:hypothetical protein
MGPLQTMTPDTTKGGTLTNERVYRLLRLPFKRLQFLLQVALQIPIGAFRCDIQQILGQMSTLPHRPAAARRCSSLLVGLARPHQFSGLTCFITRKNALGQALHIFLDRVVFVFVFLPAGCRALAERPGLWIKVALREDPYGPVGVSTRRDARRQSNPIQSSPV